MAAKKRQAQSSDVTNGKSNANKGSSRPKSAVKNKSKDEDHSKKNAKSVLYKLFLVAIGK